jgi:acetyltransferase-like isoleucine patch superfamily enzyme
MRAIRALVSLFVGLWPASAVKNRLLSRLGHHIHSSAHVSPVLLFPGSHLRLAEGARLGTFTALRGVVLRMGAFAEIGQLNWISAADFLVAPSTCPNKGMLILAEHSSLTNRHYVDASGGVVIGAFTTVAGVRSTIMTHGIDAERNLLVTAGVNIGAYCMAGSNCSFVPGASVPDRSIVGMGAVVVRGLTEPGGLYLGNPAKLKRPIELGSYGRRMVGKVPAE